MPPGKKDPVFLEGKKEGKKVRSQKTLRKREKKKRDMPRIIQKGGRVRLVVVDDGEKGIAETPNKRGGRGGGRKKKKKKGGGTGPDPRKKRGRGWHAFISSSKKKKKEGGEKRTVVLGKGPGKKKKKKKRKRGRLHAQSLGGKRGQRERKKKKDPPARPGGREKEGNGKAACSGFWGEKKGRGKGERGPESFQIKEKKKRKKKKKKKVARSRAAFPKRGRRGKRKNFCCWDKRGGRRKRAP